ncbi:KOW domain-containing RNA-binding protein [Paenibacillus sp. GSMTC-2017]|uniref:KOW domain-containing RNA-binding protein n=1 Tax=Paenibacillus sp. GSMTC-2017 TaxID=2794350 RepID=UPI0018D9DC8D|nr:KOW domain-containing RNA-binding protein [Paenibacillus sp. GSMTC-2017]MBH5320774.1 KOW domain-containing RNA-binding protein [Paenibacillus sp. GSMTC-2017]
MDARPQIGQFVKVLRGKDEESLAVVIAIIDDRFVMIADGDKRKFDLPKKKNVLHLKLQPVVSQEVINSLLETGRVTNTKLRYVIQKFAHAKGE